MLLSAGASPEENAFETGEKPLLTLTVDVAADPEVPELVRDAVDLAIREWEAGLGSSLKRATGTPPGIAVRRQALAGAAPILPLRSGKPVSPRR